MKEDLRTSQKWFSIIPFGGGMWALLLDRELPAAIRPWRASNPGVKGGAVSQARGLSCSAGRIGVQTRRFGLLPSDASNEFGSSTFLMPSSSPESFFGSGGHQACGAGRGGVLAGTMVLAIAAFPFCNLADW